MTTPSDEVPEVLGNGRTDVRVAVLSMSARSPEGRDAEYIAWHLLDHLPEQYRIGAIRHGQRWVSTPACRAARVASAPRYDAVDHVVSYLFAEPVGEGLDRFFALGAALGGAGRMGLRLPSVELGAYDLLAKVASPRAMVGADVLPWRPAQGAYLLVEEGVAGDGDEALLEVDGVAGLWRYRGRPGDTRFASTEHAHLTVCYLDGDPAATAARLAEVLPARWASGGAVPLLAAPFEAVVPWAWGAALPAG